MKKALVFTAAVFFVFGMSLEAGAQRGMMGKGQGGWGAGTHYSRMYNPQTVETLAGEVVSVDKVTPQKGMSQGVHLLLKTDKESVPVHLGPDWFLENQETVLQPGDKIEVKGSRVEFDGKPAIIAAEVKKGNQVLILRDEKGYPAWAGWRRR